MCDKAFNITKNSKYDGYQRGTASMVWKFFKKKNSDGTAKNGNKDLAEELYKQIKKTKSKLTFYRKYLRCWSCWYEINK